MAGLAAAEEEDACTTLAVSVFNSATWLTSSSLGAGAADSVGLAPPFFFFFNAFFFKVHSSTIWDRLYLRLLLAEKDRAGEKACAVAAAGNAAAAEEEEAGKANSFGRVDSTTHTTCRPPPLTFESRQSRERGR